MRWLLLVWSLCLHATTTPQSKEERINVTSVLTGYALRDRIALIFVHPVKSGGTTVRHTMQFLNGDEWTRVSLNYDHSRDGHLLGDSTYLAAHPRLYIEIHNANPYAALAGNMLLARATLRRAGWSVVTFTLLREPHDLARSYYGHFGLGGNPRHREHEAKLGLNASRFARAHAEFALCHVWGMPWLCRAPLESEPPREDAPEAGLERAASATATIAGRLTRLAGGALPANVLETGARVLGEERHARLRQPLRALLAAVASGRAALTAECGLARWLDSDGKYAGCERAPFDALFPIECAWARLHAAAYAHDPPLCARQLGEFNARLGRVDIVGITERWTESMLLVARAIGLRRLPRMRVNVRASAAARRAPDVAADAVELSACSVELYARWRDAFARRLASADAEYNATLARLLVTLSESVVRDKGPGLRQQPAAAAQPASRPAPPDAEALRARYARKAERIAARISALGDGAGSDSASAAVLSRLRARRARIAALISESSTRAAAAQGDATSAETAGR